MFAAAWFSCQLRGRATARSDGGCAILAKNRANDCAHPRLPNGEMPACTASACMAAHASRAAAHAQRRTAAARSAEDGNTALEAARPRPVQVPPDAGWPQAPGVVHSSPTLALRRRCGDGGGAFTPIRDDSKTDLASNRSTSSVGLRAACCVAGWVRRLIQRTFDVINSTTVQTLCYFAFVVIFQLLTESLRLKEEYHFDKVRRHMKARPAPPQSPFRRARGVSPPSHARPVPLPPLATGLPSHLAPPATPPSPVHTWCTMRVRVGCACAADCRHIPREPL